MDIFESLMSGVAAGNFKIDADHRWGYELHIINTEWYCAKLLVLENHFCSSTHKHIKKREAFVVLQGVVHLDIIIDDTDTLCSVMYPGDKYTIDRGTFHRFFAATAPAIILEVSTHDDPKDNVKVDDYREQDKESRGVGDRREPEAQEVKY